MPFAEKKEFLNPRFESYHLASGVTLTTLATWPSKRFSSPDGLGWKESRYRANFNHLCSIGDGVAWIDSEGLVWMAAPELKQIAALPRAKSEYPRLVVLSSKKWLLSDGAGKLYLHTSSVSELCERKPFKLHHAESPGDDIRAVISTLEQAYTISLLTITSDGRVHTTWEISSEMWPDPIRFTPTGCFLGTTAPLHQRPITPAKDHAYSWTQGRPVDFHPSD
jgi:hypothetical protein